MKKFSIQIILLLLVIFGALAFFSPVGNTPKLEIPFLPSPTQFKTLDINGTKLKVEIADTDAKRNQGLGGRESMATDAGMLFVYSKPGSHPFWMKGMKFALDFIWINKGIVVDVISNAPAPALGSKDSDLVIYTSNNDADQILEINAGMIQKLNIKVGDAIKFQ